MLKNLNDMLTFITLILGCVLTIRLASGVFVHTDEEENSFWTLLKHYRDNEED